MFSVISISFLLACLSHVATWSSSFTNFGCNSRKLSVRIGELRTQLGSTIEETCLSGRSISGFITLRNGFKNWTRTQNKHDLASLHVWWNEVRTWTWPSLPSLSVLLQGYTYKMSFFGTSLHIRSVTFLQFPLSFPAWFCYCAIVSCSLVLSRLFLFLFLLPQPSSVPSYSVSSVFLSVLLPPCHLSSWNRISLPYSSCVCFIFRSNIKTGRDRGRGQRENWRRTETKKEERTETKRKRESKEKERWRERRGRTTIISIAKRETREEERKQREKREKQRWKIERVRNKKEEER